MTLILLTLVCLLLGGIIYLYLIYTRLQSASQLEIERERLLQTQRTQQCQSLEAELARVRTQSQQALEADEVTIETLRAQVQTLSVEQASLTTQLELVREQLSQEQRQKEQVSQELKLQFKDLANTILQERSEELSKKSLTTLDPLREDLKRFGEQVARSYQEEARQRVSLQTEIKLLMERSLQISKETTDLTRALKGDSKMQGDWGEVILENILANSGLRRDEEYFVQEVLRNADGQVIREEGRSFRPDVIVRYPNGGELVIDSKVSLTAYANYVAEEDPDRREVFAQAHLESIRKHIQELSNKDYGKHLKLSPNFVMMFIPNEPAYTLAMTLSPTLWETAYQKGVILINGTNLIAALRMTQDMWARDKQTKNVEQIVKLANDLYNKFQGFAESFLKVEKTITEVANTFAKAKGQLLEGNGNFARRLEALRGMGVNPKKTLPPSLLGDTPDEE